jgi:hypothetical protein
LVSSQTYLKDFQTPAVEPYSPFISILKHEKFSGHPDLVHGPIESGSFPDPYLKFHLFLSVVKVELLILSRRPNPKPGFALSPTHSPFALHLIVRPNQALPTACFVRVRRCADVQSRLQQQEQEGGSEEESSGRGNRGRDGGSGRGRVETKKNFTAAIIACWKCAAKN